MCRQGCPIQTPIPMMIKAFKEGDLNEAGEMLFSNNPMSMICSLVCNHESALVGYYSLAIKPISIQTDHISKTMAKKLSRVSTLDPSGQSYHTAAYLIAQLGKNYAISKNQQINGSILLSFALDTISKLKYSVGGVMEFLECEDNEFLLQFYTQNHFKLFSTRITTSSNHTLHQLLKFI